MTKRKVDVALASWAKASEGAGAAAAEAEVAAKRAKEAKEAEKAKKDEADVLKKKLKNIASSNKTTYKGACRLLSSTPLGVTMASEWEKASDAVVVAKEAAEAAEVTAKRAKTAEEAAKTAEDTVYETVSDAINLTACFDSFVKLESAKQRLLMKATGCYLKGIADIKNHTAVLDVLRNFVHGFDAALALNEATIPMHVVIPAARIDVKIKKMPIFVAPMVCIFHQAMGSKQSAVRRRASSRTS